MRRNKILLAILLAVFTLNATTTKAQVVPRLYKNVDKEKMNHWVDSVFKTMSMDERIGQLFIMVAAGTNTTANQNAIKKSVRDAHLGGLLFSKGTPQNQATLTNAANSAAKIPLMITLDGEWGLSMRLSGTTKFPRNMLLGAIQDDSLLFKYGQEVARQCKLMGIHVNFAPDMDVNSNEANPVIGTRSFGENPARVAKLGILYSQGLESENVMAVSKHFPGHGDTSTDSHHTLPLISHDRARLDSVEIEPFKQYIKAGLSGLMVGHLNIPALDDSGQPSSLSKNIVTDLLQDELGFTGLVFTDGLQMKGVSMEEKHCVRALQAGNDLLLGPTYLMREYESVKKAVANNELSEELINEKCKKVLAYKYILNIHDAKKVSTTNLSTNINTSHASWLNRKLNEAAVTLVKDSRSLVPLKKLDTRKIAIVSVGGTVSTPFVQTMRRYANVSSYAASDNASLLALKTKLEGYNTIIFTIHNKANVSSAIQTVGKKKDVILSFFTTPYEIKKYAAAIPMASTVVVGYENTKLAQDATAQALMGGISIDGRLPVSVKGVFNEGEGIEKKKTRLSYGAPEDVGLKSSSFDSIRIIAKEGITEKAYPGCQVLIAKDGVVIFEEAFGTFDYSSKRLVTTDDIYDIASMTKASATLPALMKVYDEDKISLKDSISKFVPYLIGSDKQQVMVKEALFHESGIASFIPYYMGAIDKSSYAGRLFSNREETPFLAQLDRSTWGRTDYKFKSKIVSDHPKAGFLKMADNMYVNKVFTDSLIVEIAKTPLRARKNYVYSCLNFILLKEAIEDVTNTDLNTFTQDNFYRKLGATTTTYNPLTKFSKERIVPSEVDKFIRKQTIQGYVHDEGAAFMGGISGNAGLFSTANDLAKLYQMYLNGGEYGGERYLSKKTMRLFTVTRSEKSRRGLGFDRPEPMTNKSGPTSVSTPLSAYGHTGFTGTVFWVDPDNKLIYIFLSNRVYPNRSNNKLSSLGIRSHIQEAIYKALKM